MMKILHILPYSPVPHTFGGAMRIYQLMSHLARRHSVSVLTFGDAAAYSRLWKDIGHRLDAYHFVPAPWTTRHRRLGQAYALFSKHSHFYALVHSTSMQRMIDRILDRERFDVILSEFAPTALYNLQSDAVKVLDAHNVEFDNFSRMAANGHTALRRFHYREESRKSLLEEVDACRRHDAVFATSARDAALLEQAAPGTRTAVIPNGVDMSFFQPSPEEPDPWTIVFTGMMAYVPNYDGMHYFLDKIFPLILKKADRARVLIVGNRPPASLLRRRSANVEVTGFVEDVRPYVRRAGVYVVPLRMGGGTRLKVLEAMAMKKPIVTTSVGCEGIDVERGVSAYVEDDPQQFAERVVELMRSAERRRQLGERGYEIARARYDWSIIGSEAERQLLALIAGGDPRSTAVHPTSASAHAGTGEGIREAKEIA